MSAERTPGQSSQLGIFPSDFRLALPSHVEALNEAADSLRTKVSWFAGRTIGGITVSGDLHCAEFETVNDDPYVRCRLGLANPFRLGGPHGATIEDANVTVLTYREMRPIMSKRHGATDRMVCDSFAYPIVADSEGFGYYTRTHGLRADNNEMVGEETLYRRRLAPLFAASSIRLLARLKKINGVLTPAPPHMR